MAKELIMRIIPLLIIILSLCGSAFASPQTPDPVKVPAAQVASSDLTAKVTELQKELTETKAAANDLGKERDQLKRELIEAEYGEHGSYRRGELVKSLADRLTISTRTIDDLTKVVDGLKADLVVAKSWGGQLLAELTLWRSGKLNPFSLPVAPAPTTKEPIRTPNRAQARQAWADEE